MAHFRIESCNFSGDITDLVLPTSIFYAVSVQFNISSNPLLTGDISGWDDFDEVMLGVVMNYCIGLTGNLNSWLLKESGLNIEASYGTQFTGLPRGHFKNVSYIKFRESSCDSNEIDDFLVYVDNYFVGGVVPLANCIYWLDGVGMGIPSATGLTSRQNIIDKYVAAGKTATITVNS